MNAEQLESFRKAVLQVLSANPSRHGLPLPAIGHHMAVWGFPSPKTDDLKDALDYLERRDPPLVEQALKIISKENKAWRLTAAGEAFLDA
jgi:hypothetical protein